MNDRRDKSGLYPLRCEYFAIFFEGIGAMQQDLIQLSRTISYALRHAPAEFGLQLDAEGWVAVQDLLAALRQRRTAWCQLDATIFTQIVEQSEKQRFELVDGKIRAFYGHSLPQKLSYTPAQPPAILYHGTTPRAAAIIQREGLRPMGRQYVHLSVELETARQVALRRTGKPVILQIDTARAQERGISFYLGNDMIWLADQIDAEFIAVLSK
jgi:putative RNA 2'-phosphotransferase